MSTTPVTAGSSSGSDPAGASSPAAPTPTGTSDGLDRGLLMVAACVVLGAVMSILDVTVVNVAIPKLAADFNTSLATIQWVATGYTLALATVIPLSAWGADRFGTKNLYMVSIVLFVAGSVLSGLAWNSASLIGFRVLQGLGGGMLMPAGMTILTRAAGPHRVGRVMSVIGVPMLLGPIAGPILGGWLVDDFSWRLIFYINVPVGVLALVMTLRVLPRDTPQPASRLDLLGLVLLSPSLALMIYGLAESANQGGFDHARVLVPIVVGAVLLVVWVRHTLRTQDALVDLKLFSNRVFSASSITLSLMIISVFGGMLLLPLYLQQVRGESALDTGLLLAPQGLGAMLAMPIAGQLTDRTGVGRIVPVGLFLVGGSFVMLTQLDASTSYWYLGAALFVMGMGMGFTMMPTFSGAMQTLRRRSIAHASTSLNIIQQVSASIGTAVLAIVLSRVTASKLDDLFASLGPAGAQAGGGSGSETGGSFAEVLAELPPALRGRVLDTYGAAYGQTFWWALVLVVIAFVVALVLLPKHKPEPVEDDDAEPGSPLMMH
jgi:EmrB/QacA subfamily drug resistance transporter